MTTKHIIWSNENLDFDEEKKFLSEEYPGYPDDELYDIMYQTNADQLDDERMNLNIQLSQPILIICDLGLWYGRRSGYSEISSGNIRDCLQPHYDYTTFYVDEFGDLRCNDTHHDGTNRYLYRVYKNDATDEQIEDLKQKLYDNVATNEDIMRVTNRIGDEIGKVYGWQFDDIENTNII